MLTGCSRSIAGRVSAEADFVTYWVAKAWEAISACEVERAGLVNNQLNSWRREQAGAGSDCGCGRAHGSLGGRAWVLDGARCESHALDSGAASSIAAGGQARRTYQRRPHRRSRRSDESRGAEENAGVAFMGRHQGRRLRCVRRFRRAEWLTLPINPNGRSNADVLKPWVNGLDVTRPPLRQMDCRLRLT